MPQGNDSFFHALSDFWAVFFRDKDYVKQLTLGYEYSAAQLYLELMEDVLNLSVREAPVFRKEYFKPIFISETDVYNRNSDGRYAVEIPHLRAAPFLYNKIIEPTVILEAVLDYDVDYSGDTDELVFNKDPFDWEGDGKPIPGVPMAVSDNNRVLSLWAPNVEVDGYDLYLNYGYLLNRFEPSTRAYQAFLQGVMQYFTRGATVRFLESALNVIMGIPVIRAEEVLQDVTVESDGSITVRTDLHKYNIKSPLPVREDILDEGNWGSLTLSALDVISSFITVKDYVNASTWWYGKYIPANLLPEETRERRLIDPSLYPNRVNVPINRTKVGDPGLYCGADFDGTVPSNRCALRRSFAYEVFERWLKRHSFYVEFDEASVLFGELPFGRLELDLISVINAGKPAYLVLFVVPGLAFKDSVRPVDQGISLDTTLSLSKETFNGADTNLVVGAQGIKVGDYYKIDSGGVVTVKNKTTDPPAGSLPDSNGYTWLVVGGANPLVTPVSGAAIADWAISLTVF